jgi:hypothetical protein
MTEHPPEYTLPTRSPYQLPVLAEENSIITKLLNPKDETDRKVKKQSKLSKYYEGKE